MKLIPDGIPQTQNEYELAIYGNNSIFGRLTEERNLSIFEACY